MADKMQVEQAYGDKAKGAVEARKQMMQAAFEAYKARTAALKPAYAERQKFTKSVPEFWQKAFTSFKPLTPFMDMADLKCLNTLTNFTIEYQADPREYDLIFEFANNPYFSNAKLVKSFRQAPLPNTAGGLGKDELEHLRSCDLQWPLQTEKVAIDWTSDEHNLIKQKPRVNPTDLEEFDLMDSLGSFFNFFDEDHDALDIAEYLENIFQEALDVYAQLNMEPDSDDSDEEDDEEDAEEIDLEQDSDEERKKRKRSKKA